jgi:hypothetical protein
VRDEIEELWSLAEECRAWSRIYGADRPASEDVHRAMINEFRRLADKLDVVASALAKKEPRRDEPP